MTLKTEKRLSIIISIIFLGIPLFGWSIHRNQSKVWGNRPLYLITFDEFARLFYKEKWKPIDGYKNSLEGPNYWASSCHQDFYQIDGKTFVFTIIGRWRVLSIVRAMYKAKNKNHPKMVTNYSSL